MQPAEAAHVATETEACTTLTAVVGRRTGFKIPCTVLAKTCTALTKKKNNKKHNATFPTGDGLEMETKWQFSTEKHFPFFGGKL